MEEAVHRLLQHHAQVPRVARLLDWRYRLSFLACCLPDCCAVLCCSRAACCAAQAMVELLDPAGQYFGNRVIAQGVPTAPDETPADALVFKRLMQVGT